MSIRRTVAAPGAVMFVTCAQAAATTSPIGGTYYAVAPGTGLLRMYARLVLATNVPAIDHFH